MALLKTAPTRPHRSYPAADDDQEALEGEDEETPIPGMSTNEQQLERRSLSDLLKSMDVSHITMHYGYCRFLEGVDQQMLKACIQDLLDYTARSAIPGQTSTRVFRVPGRDLENPTGHWLRHILNSIFTMTALDVELLPNEIYVYERPEPRQVQASRDRLIFYGFTDGAVKVEFLTNGQSATM